MTTEPVTTQVVSESPPAVVAATVNAKPAVPVVTTPTNTPVAAASFAEKPGYASTDFWVTAFSLVSTLGVGLFHWSSQDADHWSQITGQLAPVVALVVSFLVARNYVNQRSDLKKTVVASANQEELKGLLVNLLQTHGPHTETPAKPQGATGSFVSRDGKFVAIQDGVIVQIGGDAAKN